MPQDRYPQTKAPEALMALSRRAFLANSAMAALAATALTITLRTHLTESPA